MKLLRVQKVAERLNCGVRDSGIIFDQVTAFVYYENTHRRNSLVYFVCSVLAVGAGAYHSLPPHMASSVAVPDRGVYP